MKKKSLMIFVTAGVVALGYAVVSTNAFADTSATPTPTVTAPAVPSDISASLGIQAPSGLQSSPLSTMPSIGDDDGDDQAKNQSDDAGIDGDDDEDSIQAGVSVSLSDDDGDQNQSDDNQGDSDSND